jgi:hypothetical protein
LGVTIAASTFAISKAREQVAQSCGFPVDIADDVVGIAFHAARLR